MSVRLKVAPCYGVNSYNGQQGVGNARRRGRLAEAKPGVGMLLGRELETAAALVIVLFGAALLTGYMVTERLMGV
jgi:hypothetical protein